MAGVRHLWLLAFALCAFLVAPAHAATLGFSVGTATFPGLGAGTTSTPATTITITSLATPWTLRVSDADGASPTPGRMRRTVACSTGEAAFVSPLHITASSLLAATVDKAEHDLSATPTQIAHGSTSGAVSVVYKQTIGASDQIAGLCPYAVTVLWTVS